MVIVGLVTYGLTFNLDNIVQVFNRHYGQIKCQIVKSMDRDGGHWEELAARYSGFKPERVDSTPSEWWVLWYVLTYPFKPSHTTQLFRKGKKPQHRGTDTWATMDGPQQHPVRGQDDEDEDQEWLKGMPLTSEGKNKEKPHEIVNGDGQGNGVGSSRRPSKTTRSASKDKSFDTHNEKDNGKGTDDTAEAIETVSSTAAQQPSWTSRWLKSGSTNAAGPTKEQDPGAQV